MWKTVLYGTVLAVALWLVPAAWAETPTTRPTSAPAVSLQRIAALVAQLGHESAAKREQASRELMKIGVPALPELRKALDSGDIEIVARATTLVKAIRQATIGESLLWKMKLPDEGNNSWPVLTDDLVIFHGGDGNVHAVTRADGTRKWVEKTDDVVRHWPKVALADDKLICLGLMDISPTVALDAASGKVLWRNKDPYDETIARDNAIVSITAERDEILRLSPEDGTVVWRVKTSELAGSPHARAHSPQIAKDVCLIDTWRSQSTQEKMPDRLVAVELATGKKLWSIDGYSSIDSIHDGRVYMTRKAEEEKREYTFHVYDLKTGAEQETRLPSYAFGGYDQVVGEYLLSNPIWDSSAVVAYDVASGKRLWRYAPRGVEKMLTNQKMLHYTSKHGLPIAVHDGAALLIVDDGLLGVDIKTGTPRWKYSMKCTNLYGLVVRDGVAYFMDDGYPVVERSIFDDRRPRGPRYLYALDLTKASLLGMPENESVEAAE